MDKEEILAKSRLENKGRDMAAIEENRSSARFAVLFGFFFMAVLAVLITRVSAVVELVVIVVLIIVGHFNFLLFYQFALK